MNATQAHLAVLSELLLPVGTGGAHFGAGAGCVAFPDGAVDSLTSLVLVLRVGAGALQHAKKHADEPDLHANPCRDRPCMYWAL